MPAAFVRNFPYLLLVLALLLFLRLGFWQLERAEEKSEWTAKLEYAQASELEQLSEAPEALLEGSYRRVQMQGSWHPQKSFLWDSQVFEGRVGYVLLTPFQLNDGSWLLTNRGWFEGNPDRSVKPEPHTPSGERDLRGLIRPLPRAALVMQETLSSGWPKRIQQLDASTLSAAFGKPLPDLVVNLEAGQPGVFQVQRTIGTMPPEKHLGYAVQWFALALTALILMLIIWRRRRG